MSKQESFPVLSIGREDVNDAIGYALGPDLADDQMREIASKFWVALDAPEPWNVLADVVESLYGDSRPGTITIEVESGVVTAVRGLPENYRYEVLDHDVTEPTPEVETHAKCLDTSPAAERLLQEVRSALDRVQSTITDAVGGDVFGCFPSQFSQGNVVCRGEGTNPSSPICTLCRKLHGYKWVYPKESE